ncbi:hypothetical protein CKM354_000430000 [Cercospora kikuchii]|uniref:F-box domain-containing protein n=1 Tax=Cercospora kikuchii TaxID=84275 RepID=A0A9P3FB71_9PEZI|nr:uncharacterized protein CKM354_000430000 [Cercospora kikuchii]GIZ40981.1 hypothetical protein CKM354_000430000 [Cercospora kikuchii]
MSSYQQIDVTQDIMQQLPGEVVAHIASFTEKADLNNLRLASPNAAAKSSIEFAKQNLQHLRVNIRIALGDYENWHIRGITAWDHFISSDIEAVIKILDDNDRAGFVQEITFVEVREYDIAPTIDTSRDPSAPNHGIGTTEAGRLLGALLSKLTSLRKVTLSSAKGPTMDLLLYALKCRPQLRPVSLTVDHGYFEDERVFTPILSLFSQSLRALHLTNVRFTGLGWRNLLAHIRDESQIEDFTEEGSTILNRSEYLLDTTAISADLSAEVPGSEVYRLQAGSAVMKGKIGVRTGVDELWRLTRRHHWGDR